MDDGPTTRTTKHIEDVETLRALAHPLRMRLLGALRMNGPATASALGRLLGESSGSTSYHLRQLARYGFVGEDDDQPSRRERRWKALHEQTSWHSDRLLDDPAGREADRYLGERQVHLALRAAEHWLAVRDTWSAEWVGASGFSDYRRRMPAHALRALTAEISALFDRYDDTYGGDPDARPVHVFVQAMPAADAETLMGDRDGD